MVTFRPSLPQKPRLPNSSSRFFLVLRPFNVPVMKDFNGSDLTRWHELRKLTLFIKVKWTDFST